MHEVPRIQQSCGCAREIAAPGMFGCRRIHQDVLCPEDECDRAGYDGLYIQRRRFPKVLKDDFTSVEVNPRFRGYHIVEPESALFGAGSPVGAQEIWHITDGFDECPNVGEAGTGAFRSMCNRKQPSRIRGSWREVLG